MTLIGQKEGARGPKTEYLQSILTKLGFNCGKIDGIFGKRTAAALKRFQKNVGIISDGEVQKETETALLPYLRGFFIYTIKKDDDLFSLSERFNTAPAFISVANGLTPSEKLAVGREIVLPFLTATVPTDISYCHSFLEFNLLSLCRRFPFLSLFSIGKSVLGKDLYVVLFGEGKREIFYNASHHANEWITSPLLVKFIEQISVAYIKNGLLSGESAREIFQNCSLYFLPMVNPDGVDLVTGFYNRNSAVFRDCSTLNRDDDRFPSCWKANIVGVDLNLNYPSGWTDARDYKFSLGYTDPRPNGYPGPYPLSEPETKAVAAFTEKRDFHRVLAFHSQGKEIFWRYSDFSPENAEETGKIFAERSGYSLSETPPEMAFGGYKDWFIEKYNRQGYTIEVGLGKNPLPVSQFREIYKDILPILTAATFP